MSPARHETQSGTIGRHIWRFIQTGQTTWEDFADTVRKQYEAIVPPRLQGVQWQDPERAPRPSVALASNGRKVSSWFDPERTARLPSDAEEAVKLSLPDPYHTDLMRDLCARESIHYVPHYEDGTPGTHRSLADAMREFSDVTRGCADGEVSTADVREIDETIDALHALKMRAGSLRRVS